MPLTRRALALTLVLLGSAGCSDVTAPTIDRVTFDQHTATLYASDVLETSVTVSKTDGEVVVDPSVTYASSDSLVASVDSMGTIYTHAAGEAAITAAVGSVADTLHVTVQWPPVKTVVFTDDSLSLAVGDTFTERLYVLNSYGYDADHATVTYSSSAPDVASVEGPAWPVWPRVVAHDTGRAVITVTSEGIRDTLPVVVRGP